ncbi:MAG: serine/threonine-protein phosphatase [Prevotella sp.]|nr:serine/threonine-protein phosphatase [Prevotella sp.]
MRISLYPTYSFLQLGKRDNQEDARWPDTDRSGASCRAFVVCDGVGGSSHGEVASSTVCRSIGKQLADFAPDDTLTPELFSNVLDSAYNALDSAADDVHGDMATTLTMLVAHAGGVLMAHIGDSRIYQVRPGLGIVYRSDDHSLVSQMVRSGIITPEEALTHPQRNVITRFMAPTTDEENRCMASVVRTTDIAAGDYFLLCTDGVTNMVSDAMIVEALCSDDSDEQKMARLASLAAPSSDNNTATLIHIKEVEGGSRPDVADSADDNQSATLRSYAAATTVEEVESFRATESETNPISKFLRKLFNLF